MSNNPQTEAQRLADWADDRAFSDAAYCNSEYNAIADELRRLDALCDERGTNEARMLMRLTEMQATIDQLRAQLSKAVEEEREACAKVCETTAWTSSIDEWRDMTKKDVADKSMHACAAAIRARGNT